MEKLIKKLAAVKREIGKISKNAENPYFKSRYFDINALLEHTEPILEKHGLICLQPLEKDSVKTIIIDVESSEQISSEMQLPQLTDPQKMGSAITYYRRYTLQSLLALQAEDDDANKAAGKTKPETKNISKLITGCETQQQLHELYTSLNESERGTYGKQFTDRKLQISKTN